MPISVLSIAVAALILGAAGGALAARALKASRRNAAETAAMDNLLQQVDRTSQSLNARLDAVSGEMNRTFAHALQPAERWESQAPIGSARVDALVHTPHGALCIDCKFPLDNFRRALAAAEPAARDAAMKLFYSDVRGRIDEIADRYVSPPLTLEM